MSLRIRRADQERFTSVPYAASTSGGDCCNNPSQFRPGAVAAVRPLPPYDDRTAGDSRPVPCPPALTRELRTHLATFGTGAGELVFTGVAGEPLSRSTYRHVWDRARRAALSPEEYDSPLAKRPYDLRHACVSTWLNGGVPAPQVAEWAGHGVNVLLQVYAKCIVGQDEAAKRRIEAALRPEPPT